MTNRPSPREDKTLLLLAAEKVPDTDHAIPTHRDEMSAIGSEGKGAGVIRGVLFCLLAAELNHFLLCTDVPDAGDQVVRPPRCNPLAVGRESNARTQTVTPGSAGGGRPLPVHVQDMKVAVTTDRGQSLAVRRKSNRPYCFLVYLQAAQLLAAGHIPETDTSVIASGGKHFAIRRAGQPGDRYGLLGEETLHLACRYLPNVNPIIARGK